MSALMLFVSAATLVSTTYAFVILQNEAQVEELDFEIESDLGLLISLDGKNFSQDITKKMLQQQILKNTGNEGKTWSEANIKYSGVTLSPDLGNKSELYNTNKVKRDLDNNPMFQKDSLEPIAGSDYFKHQPAAAAIDDYLKLDLYFKLVEQGTHKNDVQLRFTGNTGITGKGVQDVIVDNTFTYKDVTDGTSITKRPGDVIKVDPVDAMRLAIVNHNDNHKLTVYEPTLGLGSAAIHQDGDNLFPENKHQPEYNPMLQYYNVLHPLSPFDTEGTPNEGFMTKDKIGEDIVGTFKYNDGYEIIHTTVFVFLEGWDAGFFIGIPVDAQSFILKLGFELVL